VSRAAMQPFPATLRADSPCGFSPRGRCALRAFDFQTRGRVHLAHYREYLSKVMRQVMQFAGETVAPLVRLLRRGPVLAFISQRP
jgi:hypothetical protein